MLYEDLTYEEIRNLADQGSLAILPTGCTEQQGPHLPVGFDTWFAKAIMEEASKRLLDAHRLSSLVLPPIPFGPTPEHKGFGSGYVNIPSETHDAVIHAAVTSLVEQGFSRVVVWRGCGGHNLRNVVKRLNEDWAGKCDVFLPNLPYADIWCRLGDPSVPSGHADSFATSIALHLRPEMVRVERIPQAELASVEWDDPALDFSRHSSSGVIGDPTHASAHLGALLWHECVDRAVEVLFSSATSDDAPGIDTKQSLLVDHDGCR